MSDEPARIKFYADTHIARAVAVQLRNRGVDIVRCEEVGMSEAKDFEHLEYAATEDRVVITHDDDFLRLDREGQAAGRIHAGIMHCKSHLQGNKGIGRIVRECVEWHEMILSGVATVEDDIVNHVIHVS